MANAIRQRIAAYPARFPNLHPPFGGGIGVECSGRGAATARNITGGDFQSKGVGGTWAMQGLNRLCPSAFFSSKMMPGRANFWHSCHCAIAIQSLIEKLRSPSTERWHISNEVEIIAGEMRKHGVLQRDRVCCINVDCHIGPDLSGVHKHIGKICKHVVAQFDCVFGRLKISNAVFANGRGEHECIVSAISEEHFVGRRAGERLSGPRPRPGSRRPRCWVRSPPLLRWTGKPRRRPGPGRPPPPPPRRPRH